MNATEEFLTEAFIEQGLVTRESIEELLNDTQEISSVSVDVSQSSVFMNLLLETLGLSSEEVVNFLSAELNMDSIDMALVNPTSEILSLLTPENARRYEAVPLGTDGTTVDVVLGNPIDQDAIENLEHLLAKPINPKIAYRESVLDKIAQVYGFDQEAKEKEFFEGFDGEVQIEDNTRSEDISEEDAPIIRFVHSVIKEALEKRASDIHMEPLEKKFRIRYRIDGKLIEQPDPPKRLQPSIISRTKLMANVSLAEKRVPLDGRINVKVGEKVIDLRVSTLPTVHGESIVMRILDKESLSLGLPPARLFFR